MATNDSAPMNKRMEHRYMLHLGKQCYLFDSNFRDTIYIHIRELAFRDNQPLPTAKGIALTLLKCNELYTCLPPLDIEVAQLKRNKTTFLRRHLGGNWFVTVQSGFNCVDIRKFWLPENTKEICATRKGISLTFDQYEELKCGLRTIPSFVPELYDVRPCYTVPGHNHCHECQPNRETNNQ